MNVEKVVVVQKRMFLTFFDHKPVIMKPWSENVDCTKDNVRSIPIWVQLYLDFKKDGDGVKEKAVEKELKDGNDQGF
ncbi:Alanine--tRNA ligase [Bienertia sinuspersici]